MKSSSHDVPPSPRSASVVARRPRLRAAVLFAASAVLVLIVPIGCLEPGKCRDLKDQRYAERRIFEACEPGIDECMVIGGAGNDCTGVYSCSIAVNKRYRDAAEQAVIAIVADSPVCNATCAQLSCGSGQEATCDRVTKRCIVGSASFTQPNPIRDSGAVPNPPVVSPSDSGGD